MATTLPLKKRTNSSLSPPPEDGDKIADSLPGSTLVTIPASSNTGHYGDNRKNIKNDAQDEQGPNEDDDATGKKKPHLFLKEAYLFNLYVAFQQTSKTRVK